MNTFDTVAIVKTEPEIKTTQQGKQLARVLLHVKKGYYNQTGDWMDQSFTINASAVFGRVVETIGRDVHKGCKVAATIGLNGYKMEDENGEPITRIGYTIQDIEVLVGPPTNGHGVKKRTQKDEEAELAALAKAHEDSGDSDIPF